MVLGSSTEINQVMETRVSNNHEYGAPIRAYIDKVVALLGQSRLGTLTESSPLPDVKPVDLRSLRSELERKYVIAYNKNADWSRRFKAITEDIETLSGALSEDVVSLKKEELKKQLMVMKKRIEELSRKKNEISQINDIISQFETDTRAGRFGKDGARSYASVQLTEDELVEVFGDRADQIKKMRGVTFERKWAIAEKKVDGATEGETVKKENTMFMTYKIRASLSESVSKLQETKEELIARAEYFEKEIQQLKEQYLERLKMFDAIKRIVGLEDEEMKTEDQVEEDEEDEEEELLGAPASDVDEDDDARSETHLSRTEERSDDEIQPDHQDGVTSPEKDAENDVVMA